MLRQIQEIIDVHEDHFSRLSRTEKKKTKTKIAAISKNGIGTGSRKTLFDYQTLNASEGRFENNNLLPNVASKFKRNNRGFSIHLMSDRDENTFIGQCNGEFRSV